MKIFLIIILILIILVIRDSFFKKDNIVIFEKNNNIENISKKKKDEDIKEKVIEFSENFSNRYVIEESSTMDKSNNKKWWVNSGAFLYSKNGVGRTIFGKLEKNSKWQIKFANSNHERMLETDKGYRPQNIFRLVTRTKWKNFKQTVYFKIKKYNLSKDKHRSESNGLLLFNRYKDGDNLYYVGLRVDGCAIIKKKINGKYITLDKKKIFNGVYNRDNKPNLLPINKWIGVKSEVKTNDNNEVVLKLFLDMNKSGNWKQIINIKDDSDSLNGNSILGKGYAGIRTDFMDVEFDDYKIVEISE